MLSAISFHVSGSTSWGPREKGVWRNAGKGLVVANVIVDVCMICLRPETGEQRSGICARGKAMIGKAVAVGLVSCKYEVHFIAHAWFCGVSGKVRMVLCEGIPSICLKPDRAASGRTQPRMVRCESCKHVFRIRIQTKLDEHVVHGAAARAEDGTESGNTER